MIQTETVQKPPHGTGVRCELCRCRYIFGGLDLQDRFLCDDCVEHETSHEWFYPHCTPCLVERWQARFGVLRVLTWRARCWIRGKRVG